MTCSCTRTDIIEKEPSIIEDYDPYRSWHGSQYGSRFDFISHWNDVSDRKNTKTKDSLKFHGTCNYPEGERDSLLVRSVIEMFRKGGFEEFACFELIETR